ncbi:BlaI/MecI/CopY family transcriptional regulator [Streptomyces sp. NPDC005931]|uniref:BlaI/MecI/CopY family transcriptional regulator n=1 Tax=Streptomyces sp. NPDC005931 TaxID=3364737 RepID=UPI0036956295
MVREVSDRLAQEHPGRATSVQTVRNSLDTLVKKGLAEKSRQQGNTMYTAFADAEAAAASEMGEAEQASGAQAEKQPAKV